MKLSVLDQAPITKGNTAENALHNAIELALLSEELGYERMWMAEHHNTNSLASSAPEITIAHIAAKTKKLRLGTGGTMIMHYAPYKMAEVFKTLSALTPGRIDFGIGRAPGGDRQAMFALTEGRPPQVDNLYEKLDTTLKLILDEVPEHPLYEKIVTSPFQITLPEAWLLGSSGNSALETARRGLGYSYAQFFNGTMSKDVLDAYKKSFVPSAFMDKPSIMVSYLVTTADTKEEAEFQAKPADIGRLQLMRGRIEQRMTPEEAKDYPLTEIEKMMIKENRNAHLVGSATEVADMLQREQQIYGFDEAMICSIPHSQEVRLDVYRLLAKQLLS